MIAEFMLHRTKANQVVPIYADFLRKYPSISYLSVAKKSDIKKVTKHLGLHWRADHFIEAAKFVVENFNGKFPDDSEKLLTIPGIGSYIAGAISTVCFNKPYPVVDSNIARFINRYYDLSLEGEIRRKKEIINIADILFKVNYPGQFLFAIIDFTSLVCKPISPDCINCSLKTRCGYNTTINSK
jgi:A/G-specific adenine glycosylase